MAWPQHPDATEATVRERRLHDPSVRLSGPLAEALFGVLAAQAPRLDRVLIRIAKEGEEVVLIDGTPHTHPARTGSADRRNHSGKHRTLACPSSP
ncbi:hypothetical protein [Streptomyces griseoluteus]